MIRSDPPPQLPFLQGNPQGERFRMNPTVQSRKLKVRPDAASSPTPRSPFVASAFAGPLRPDPPLERGIAPAVGVAPSSILRPDAIDPGYRLDEIVDAQAARFAAWRDEVGDFLARELAQLANRIRFTGALTVDDYEARAELWDAWSADASRSMPEI